MIDIVSFATATLALTNDAREMAALSASHAAAATALTEQLAKARSRHERKETASSALAEARHQQDSLDRIENSEREVLERCLEHLREAPFHE